MSFGVAKIPPHRIRAMSAHPKFPVEPNDPDEYFEYAAKMRGKLGLNSAIQPRRARSASPRRSRASIEYEMLRLAQQNSPSPPQGPATTKRKKRPRSYTYKPGKARELTSQRDIHSRSSCSSRPVSAAPRPKSAAPTVDGCRTKSPKGKVRVESDALPPRPKSAFVRRKEVPRVTVSEPTGLSEESVVSALHKVSFTTDNTETEAARRKISAPVSPRRSTVSGMWSKSLDLMRRKSFASDFSPGRRQTGSKFLELVLRMKDGGQKKRRSLYLSPLERFQRVAHCVKVLMGLCLHMKRTAHYNAKEEWSFMEYHLNLEAELNQLMAFRMEQFTNRNTRKDRGSEKLKQLLSLRPEERSDRDLYIIAALIKTNEAFQEYPQYMQEKLCKTMMYQSYEARRVLYKEDNVAHYFYILLTGSVIMNVKEFDQKSGNTFSHTISELNEGQSFGEQAFLRGTKRVTTAICKTEVELLVLYRTDFDEIIRIPLQSQRENHTNFVKSLELFKDFPIEYLEDKTNLRDFFYQYFKKGTIVVKNNKTYKFLVIVKSGKCNILVEYKQALRRVMKDMPKLSEADEKLFPRMCDRIKKQILSKTSQMTLDLRRDDMRGRMMRSLMPDMTVPGKMKQRRKDHGSFESLEDAVEVPTKLQDADEKKERVIEEKKEELLTPFSIGAAVARIGASVSLRKKREEEAAIVRESVQKVKRKGPDDKKESERENGKWSGMSIQDLPGEYAKVACLETGAVFGLETLFDSSTNEEELPLVLSSEGAECLILSKKLFLRGANARVLNVVSDMVVGWPSAEFVGQKIKEHRDWQSYKQYVIADVMEQTKSKSRVMSAHL